MKQITQNSDSAFSEEKLIYSSDFYSEGSKCFDRIVIWKTNIFICRLHVLHVTTNQIP